MENCAFSFSVISNFNASSEHLQESKFSSSRPRITEWRSQSRKVYHVDNHPWLVLSALTELNHFPLRMIILYAITKKVKIFHSVIDIKAINFSTLSDTKAITLKVPSFQLLGKTTIIFTYWHKVSRMSKTLSNWRKFVQ